ncbi:MAG: hypothetical protein ACRDYB_16775 [Acidimicrobiales bacterium]
MRLPVDTSAVNFVTAGPAEPALDFDTKAQKTDDGQPVFNVHLFALGGGSRDVITVKLTGTPKGLGEFTPVRVSGLVATTWSMGERSGVSFKASSIEPVISSRPAS